MGFNLSIGGLTGSLPSAGEFISQAKESVTGAVKQAPTVNSIKSQVNGIMDDPTSFMEQAQSAMEGNMDTDNPVLKAMAVRASIEKKAKSAAATYIKPVAEKYGPQIVEKGKAAGEKIMETKEKFPVISEYEGKAKAAVDSKLKEYPNIEGAVNTFKDAKMRVPNAEAIQEAILANPTPEWGDIQSGIQTIMYGNNPIERNAGSVQETLMSSVSNYMKRVDTQTPDISA